jgi:hypothetical protein
MLTGFWRKSLRRRDHSEMWNDNVRMDVKEIGFWGTDWINLAQDRQVVCSCGHRNKHSSSVKFRMFFGGRLGTVNF